MFHFRNIREQCICLRRSEYLPRGWSGSNSTVAKIGSWHKRTHFCMIVPLLYFFAYPDIIDAFIPHMVIILSFRAFQSYFLSMGTGKKSHQINGRRIINWPSIDYFHSLFPIQNVGYSCMQCCTNSFDASLHWPKLPFKKNSPCWSSALMARKTFLHFYSEFLDPNYDRTSDLSDRSGLSMTCHCFVFQIFGFNFIIHTLPASAIFYISIQHNVSEKFFASAHVFYP